MTIGNSIESTHIISNRLYNLMIFALGFEIRIRLFSSFPATFGGYLINYNLNKVYDTGICYLYGKDPQIFNVDAQYCQ